MKTLNDVVKRWWFLTDPTAKNPDNGKPVLLDPDNQNTTDPGDAKLFPSEDDAKKHSDGLKPKGQYVPKPVSDFWPPKK